MILNAVHRDHLLSKMIPGEALIYENANGVVYAHYRDPPHNSIPRWIIGGDPDSVQRAQGNLFSYRDWQDIERLAKNHPTVKKQLDKLLVLYYIVKDKEKL